MKTAGTVALATASLLLGCPAAPSAPDPTPRAVGRSPASSDGGTDAATAAIPSLDSLASRQPWDAPGMREVGRSDRVASAPLGFTADHARCVRAIVASRDAVRATFRDAQDVPRGDAMEASSGLVPARGPACLAEGETIRLIIDASDGGAAAVHAVLFASP